MLLFSLYVRSVAIQKAALKEELAKNSIPLTNAPPIDLETSPLGGEDSGTSESLPQGEINIQAGETIEL